ncbi:MAG TPA: amidohydrolase family protein, partial [Propionibacteriaceae bacterium]|nr:amidohydrolase family protein [Propionibacteriaceae bacterium]
MSTLLRSVRRVPLDGEPADAVDVLLSDGVIAGIGVGLDPGDAVVEDCEGLWVAPGLWDEHVHFEQWAQSALRVDISGTQDPAEACRRVADHVASLDGPPDQLVVGFGHRLSSWTRQPATAELDAVSGAHPVILMAGDAHSGWLNTAAQRLYGVSFDGVCTEEDWFSLMPRVADDPQALAGARRRRISELFALGVVGLVDMVMNDHLGPWQGLAAEGVAVPRVAVGVFPGTLDEVVQAGLRTGDALPGGDGLLRMGPLKIIADGSLSSLTAARRDAYGNVTGHFAYTLDELVDLQRRGRAQGLAVATHAIGDACLSQVLDAYEASGATGTIEHAQLVDRTEIARIVRLGLPLSVQPWHLVDDWRAMDALWADRCEDAFPFRSLLDAGVMLRLGSDAPVAPLDPWKAMAAAVHRNTPDLESWHPEERISATEAFRSSVRTRVSVGQPADVVLLESNPLQRQGDSAATAAHLLATRVAA